MNDKNIIVYVSSRNNYDMLEGEVLKFDFEGYEFINVDDDSSPEEISKGKRICQEHNVIYLQNKGRGVQMATQTLIDYINENRPECKYIICFQHDVKPISENFFSTISSYVDSGKLDDFGGIGFNIIDNGKYTGNAYQIFKDGNYPLGMLGLAHLSVENPTRRWMSPSPHHNPKALDLNPDKWSKPFIIEIPIWVSVGINVDVWNKYVKPTDEYQFHLWFPDVAMQMNKSNKPLLIIPTLYCLNQQEIKLNYGISDHSANAAKSGNEYHFGKYSNFGAWKSRWGWEYENVKNTYPKDIYKGTLIEEYFNHDIVNKGPIRNYEL